MIELCSGYLSECGFTLKRVRHMTRTYSQMHCTNKCSEHSSVIWPVRPNGLVFLYELSGSGFEFICRISKDSLLLHLLSCKSLIFVKENPDRKKINYALEHVRTDFRCVMDEERLDSFMTEILII